MIPLPSLDRVRGMFGSAHLSLVIDAIIAGNSPATAWADDLAAPSTVLIWDRAHSLYLAGGLAGDWQELFHAEIAPAGSGMFKLHGPGPVTELAGRVLQARERVFYRGVIEHGVIEHTVVEHGVIEHGVIEHGRTGAFLISPISDELAGLANFGAVADEVESCWISMAAFRAAGFGFCAHDDETIMSWCTAEYVSQGRCGIGVETAPAFRQRGLATATATALVRHCAAQGIVPHWDSWSANTPSVLIAGKLGFRKLETYTVSVGDFGSF